MPINEGLLRAARVALRGAKPRAPAAPQGSGRCCSRPGTRARVGPAAGKDPEAGKAPEASSLRQPVAAAPLGG